MAKSNKSANRMNWSKMERVEQRSFTFRYAEAQTYIEEMKEKGYYVRTTSKGKTRKVFVYKKVTTA